MNDDVNGLFVDDSGDRKTKASFDARLYYVKLLSQRVAEVGEAKVYGSFQDWLSAIENLFILSRPYIDKKSGDDIAIEINRIHNLAFVISGSNKYMDGYNQQVRKLNLKLNNLCHDLMGACKDLLLPSRDDDVDSGFDEGSGI